MFSSYYEIPPYKNEYISESESESESEDEDENKLSQNSYNSNVNVIKLEELEDSYYYNVLWTSKEKENLFKGIEKYGKWNVNKIKKLLPHKTITDIQMYISLLHRKYKSIKKNKSYNLYKKKEIYKFYENDILESTEEEIKIEEEKATHLISEEQSLQNTKNIFNDNDYSQVEELFNIHLLLSLTSKLFIRNKNAGIHNDTLILIYYQYIQWLIKVIKIVAIVSAKRGLRKKNKGKIFISVRDLNETFRIMNFKNYKINSPLSKLIFRKQGHIILYSVFNINSNVFNDFTSSDAEKSIIDDRINTWVRPYNIEPRYYHTYYNDIINDTLKVKQYFEKIKEKKKKASEKYRNKRKLDEKENDVLKSDINKRRRIENNTDDMDDENYNDNDDNNENENNYNSEEDDEEEDNDDNSEKDEDDDEDEEEDEEENEEEGEEEDDDENNSKKEYDEDEEGENEYSEDDYDDDEYDDDDNYNDEDDDDYEGEDDDDDSKYDNLINNSYITRRSSRRLANNK